MTENNFPPDSHQTDQTDEINADKPNRPIEFYAHSLEGKLPSEWQPLETHLKNVADLAGSFAREFGARDWGYLWDHGII